MRVLTLELRNENPEQLQQSERKIYKTVVVFTVLFWLGVVIDLLMSYICETRAEKTGNNELKCLDAHLSHHGAQYLNGTLFFILFALMMITAVPLCRVMKQATAGNQTLSSNVKWLTTIFAVFTVGFLSRMIYDYVTKIDGGFVTEFLGLALPLFWDFLPIFLMSLFHLKDVRIEKR